MKEIGKILQGLDQGDVRSLARAISVVENELPGSEEILSRPVSGKQAVVIGITGPPGAGKSTLINAMAGKLAEKNKVAILAVDPTSPFTHGSLLGDRLRMSGHFNNKNIFIRSLATRGSLGGLSAKAMEITDVLKSAGFDYILIETVGVGQSEVEIVSMADTTIVVFVPESGDEIQALKSGIMEIGDIVVINKADREGADIFAKNIRQVLHHKPFHGWEIPVIKTVAIRKEGVKELMEQIEKHRQTDHKEKNADLLLQKALHLVQAHLMRSIDKKSLAGKLSEDSKKQGFNIYQFVKEQFALKG